MLGGRRRKCIKDAAFPHTPAVLSSHSIAWEYDPESKIVSIDQYEELRPERRSHFEMILPRAVRQQMLRKEWDVSQAQIAAAVRNNIKIKNQRRTTVNNLGKSDKFEELMESCTKKFTRTLLLKKSVKKEAQELEFMHCQAQRALSASFANEAIKQMTDGESYEDEEEETKDMDSDEVHDSQIEATEPESSDPVALHQSADF